MLDPRLIRYGKEIMEVNEKGEIYRPKLGMGPSRDWLLKGAVIFNNFGHVIETYTGIQLFLTKPEHFRWFYRHNGKQRIHIVDIDHGTERIWMNPDHEIL